MKKSIRSRIRKWDEIGGISETEIEESASHTDEEPGAGPSVSKNPMRGVEDMLEQNDNSFDGVINNLPKTKPLSQMTREELEEQHRKLISFFRHLEESGYFAKMKVHTNRCPMDDRERI